MENVEVKQEAHQAVQQSPQGRPMEPHEQKTMVLANIIGGHTEALKQLVQNGADEDAQKVHVKNLADNVAELKAHTDGVVVSESQPAVHPDWVPAEEQVTHALAARVADAAEKVKASVTEMHPAEVVETHHNALVDATKDLVAHKDEQDSKKDADESKPGVIVPVAPKPAPRPVAAPAPMPAKSSTNWLEVALGVIAGLLVAWYVVPIVVKLAH